MKTQLLALAISGLTLSAGAFAEDKDKDVKKDGVVIELDVKDLECPFVTAGGAALVQPISAEKLPGMISDEKIQKRLKKEVDFSKQQLILITWRSDGDDKVTYTVEKGEKVVVVTFRYEQSEEMKRLALREYEEQSSSKPLPERSRRQLEERRRLEEALTELEEGKKKKLTWQFRAFTIPRDALCFASGFPQGKVSRDPTLKTNSAP
jgi:hypothetical protein